MTIKNLSETINDDFREMLPEGWSLSHLVDICEIIRGVTFPASAKRTSSFDGSIVCLRTTNVQDVVTWEDVLHIPESYVKKQDKLLQQGDTLISMANSYELVGKVAHVDVVPVRSTLGGFIAALRSREGILPKYLFYHLRTHETQQFFRRNSSQTVNIANLSLRTINPTPIRIAPLPEQHRIVAEIEKQFTRLDAAVAALERAQANLVRYKASVLKAACEGRLVPQDPEAEPAAVLLERILAERRRQWEEQEWAGLVEKARKKAAQAARKAAGQPARLSDLEPADWEELPEAAFKQYLPKNEKWKAKYQEPDRPDTEGLPELPEGWVWATAEQLCNPVASGSTPKSDLMTAGAGDIPFLKVYNLTHNGSLDFTVNPTFVSEFTHHSQLARSRLRPGDVLMNIVGPPLGKVSVVTAEYEEWNMNQAIVGFRPIPNGIDHRFLASVFLAPTVSMERLYKTSKTTAGQRNLNVSACRKMILPLPPRDEQLAILSELDSRMPYIEQLELTLNKGLLRVAKMKQSILRTAFTGRLVPQDLDDEPASNLLARIRAERETQGSQQMKATELSRLEQVELRTIWQKEDGDFTPWLAQEENISLLGETLGLNLETDATEKYVGPYRADIVCRDIDNDSWVLIENQLEPTNHKHLGQLLTYAAGLDTVTIIWIAASFTDQHRAALDWLNEITDERANFFGLEIELWRIANSPAAPKFNIISQPNDWQRTVRDSVQHDELTERRRIQIDYWTALVDRITSSDSVLRPRRPRPLYVLSFPLGRAGFHLDACIYAADQTITVFLILGGSKSKVHFHLLEAQKDEIEREIGEALNWLESPEQQRSHIGVRRKCDPDDRADWENQHAWLQTTLERFQNCFQRRIRALNASDYGAGDY